MGVFLCLPAQVNAAVITVDSTSDTDATDGECTLREAINNANSDVDTTGGDCVDGFGTDQIQFNIGGGGPQTIIVGTDLPEIISPVEIDATTQPGGGGCFLKDYIITLTPSVQDLSGFTFGAGSEGSILQGFVIVGFQDDGNTLDGDINNAGVVAYSQNTIRCNAIGVNNSSSIDGNTIGIRILGESNVIGGSVSGYLNIISGNDRYGIYTEPNAHLNTIHQNFIGTDKSGIVARRNAEGGIYLQSNNNTVGGDETIDRNTISGNTNNGIDILGTGNLIQGNYIGLNSTGGSTGVGNTGHGIYVNGDSNTIGGSNAGEGNLISANSTSGVTIDSEFNTISGNLVGVNKNGDGAFPNATGFIGNRAGIVLSGNNNVVGGETSIERNIVSGNARDGILVFSTGNSIKGNYIGVSASGDQVVANQRDGISLQFGADNNTIGGSLAGEGNVISGNDSDGIQTFGDNTTIHGNYIGVDSTGNAVLSGQYYGVQIFSASNNIGGANGGEGNVISGNEIGVYLSGSGNNIKGNNIGLAADGSALGNDVYGIEISADAQTIGGTTPNEANYISANGTLGIMIYDFLSTQSNILGNYIGVNSSGNVEAGFGNGINPGGAAEPGGILVKAGSEVKIGGLNVGESNTIAGNQGSGIIVSENNGNPTRNVSILGNSLFENTGLGIDLSTDTNFDNFADSNSGNTPNDATDADSGANDYLNYIEVQDFTENSPGNYTVFYDLDVPAGDYVVQFFSNRVADSSGFGEAEFLAGSANVSHTGSGSESFDFDLILIENDYLTSTVTQLVAPTTYGKTSELSEAEVITNTTTTPAPSGNSSSGSASTVDYKSPFDSDNGGSDTDDNDESEPTYKEEIQAVIDAGLVLESEEPNTPADKCEALLIMSRYYKWDVPESDTTPFGDVPEWCVSLSNYGYEIGVVEGIQPGVLGMGRDMMRYEFVLMLYRFLEAEPVNIENPFKDDLVSWAKTAVLWSYEKEVVKGYEDGTFGGKDNILKQDLAIILNRFAK